MAWYLYQYRDLKRAAAIHVTSTLEANNIKKMNIRRPIAMVPNGTDIPHEICSHKKSKNENRIALCLCRIHPKKGLINLINAWSKVMPSGWKVIIAGPDESNHRNQVQKEIRRLELSDTISVEGEVPDSKKWKLYNNSDLFILPSYSENFGIVVAEALACGLPVITTKGTPWEIW